MTSFASEPGDELCPPYWPALLWWLIHHGGDPVKGEEIARIDEAFAVLAVRALAVHIADERVSADVTAAVGTHPALALLG